MTGPVTILWFKRDLRLADNPALSAAVQGGDTQDGNRQGGGAVIPLYVIDPVDWGHPDASARQWDFVAESLAELRADLARLGAPLVVRQGAAVGVLEALRQAHPVTRLVSQQETGLLGSWQRDRAVAAWARAHGIAWAEPRDSGVERHLASRDGWAARRARFMSQPVLPVPAPLTAPPLAQGPIPEAAALGLPDDPCPERQRGGRRAGLALLRSFLAERGARYRAEMSSPLSGAQSCSRLSPHLAWGTLSVREVEQACLARAAELRGTGWAKSLSSFKSRLAWRDHFTQKLEDFPLLDTHCLHSGFEGMRPRLGEAAGLEARLEAWAQGRTGLPFVDACMRHARATGWLNFRMRAMVQAVASYHLWLDWRDSGPVLARLWTDYAPGIHWAQSQMQSGVTGINTVRVYNPVKQGHDQDPTGAFTRRWVPELADVPAVYLQEPWRAPAPPAGYPPPIVDVQQAARIARDRIHACRKGAAFHAEADRVQTAHGSRKSGMRQVGRRPRGPSRPRPPAQAEFDF